MDLFSAYLLVGGVFSLAGLLLFCCGERLAAPLNALPRSRVAAILLWSAALTWFFYHLAGISEVDLAGFPRWAFFALFGGAGILAFKFLEDLLSLRAIAVLILFVCNELLKIGFGHTPYSVVLAGTAYLLIIGALWTGASPYVLRNAIAFTTQSTSHTRLIGGVVFLLGFTNLIASFFVK